MSARERDFVRVHLYITGRVQGVWFRGAMLREAELSGACGWVRNLADGTVEAVVEGESALVDRMVAWSRVGPPAARVDQVRVISEPPERLSRFEIRYGASE